MNLCPLSLYKMRAVKFLFFTLVMGFFLALPLKLYAEIEKIHIRVDGLSCPFCVYGVEEKLKEIDAVREVSTDLKYGLIHLSYQPGKPLDLPKLFNAVKRSGFTPISAELEARGVLKRWKEHPAVQLSGTKQIFLLIPFKENQTLPSALEQNEGKTVSLRGEVHTHVDFPVSLKVISYEIQN